VDPPRGNPYDEPGYFESPYDRSFIVTKNLSGQATDEPGGGLLGRLSMLSQQGRFQPAIDSVSTLNGAPEYRLQGGLLGRLLALQMQQNQVQPMAESNGQTPEAWDDMQSSQARRPIRSLVARILSEQSDDQ
jgi:hypothetical protein